MLAIAKMGRHSRYYYVNLAQSSGEASSAEPGEPPAVWGGSGAARLGLAGPVTRGQFFAAFDGFAPEGDRRLVDNAGGERRVPGWDLVFTPPKSVSILWAVTGGAARTMITRCHHRAVEAAVAYLERQARLHTPEAPLAGLTIAFFEHGSNRAGHPNLHTHALVLNEGVTAEGVTGPIQSRILYRHKMAAGALYRSELAMLLSMEAGLAVERCSNWFEVKGFSRTGGRYQELMNLWSGRRREIEAHEPVTAAQAQMVAHMTREKKGVVPPRDELHAAWRTEASRYGLTPQQVERMMWPGRERSLLGQRFAEWRTLREARRMVVMYQSHFTRRDLVHAIAVAAQARGVGSSDVLRLAESCLRHQQVMSMGTVQGEERFTMKRLYRLEQSLVAETEALAAARGRRVPHRYLAQAAAGRNLSGEQRRALSRVTDAGRLAVLTGISGTGKSETLLAAAHAYRQNGYAVVAVSPSRHGAERLGESGLERQQGMVSRLLAGSSGRSITVAKLFAEIDRARAGQLRYGSRSLATYPITRRTVVMVDDAQLLSTAWMERLVREVRRAGGKLVLSGDLQARQAAEHGGALRALARRSPVAVCLGKIRRQEMPEARHLVEGIGTGQAAAVVKSLEGDGVLHLAASEKEAKAQLIADWVAQAGSTPREHLIVTDTKEEAAALNRMARKALHDAGTLCGLTLKVRGEYFSVGDRVILQETSATYGVTKGSTGTIKHLEPLTRIAVVKLDSGKTRLLNLRHYRGLAPGYCLTAVEAKGHEARYGYVFTKGRGQDVALMQVSRATVSTRIYSYGAGGMSDAARSQLGRQMVYRRSDMELAVDVGREANQRREL